MINAIVATDKNLGIGKNGAMPWPRNEADMLWFRKQTNDGVIVMGRKTWDSIENNKLANRVNVVVTNSDIKGHPDLIVAGSMLRILDKLVRDYPMKTIWIIGGGEIYRQALPYVETLYRTVIPGEYECDTFFDEEQFNQFKLTMSFRGGYDATKFEIWRR